MQSTCCGQEPRTVGPWLCPLHTTPYSNPSVKLGPSIKGYFTLPFSATKSQPGPLTTLPFGKNNPLYFGEENKTKTWASQESTEEGRRTSLSTRGHSPELSGPHLQSPHATPLGATNITHDIISNHDGLSHSEMHSEAMSGELYSCSSSSF